MPSAKDLFGKQLRILRLGKHLSQEKLGARCGYHRNQIGKIERAEQKVSFNGILRLSYGLQLPPAEIWKLVPTQTKLPPKKKKKTKEKAAL